MGVFIRSSISSKSDNSIKNTISNMVDHTNDAYSSSGASFFDSPPNFVTLFHVNKKLSTTSVGDNDIYELLGDESPIRFNKVKDFVLYGVTPANAETESDEVVGIRHILTEQEAIVLPDTVVVTEQDCFKFNNMFYKVTSVDNTLFRNKSYIKIKFEHITVEDVEIKISAQVIENYQFVYENIGTEVSTVLREDTYLQLIELEAIISDINESYIDTFYNTRVNALVVYDDTKDKYFYSPLLVELQNEYGIIYDDVVALYLNKETNLDKDLTARKFRESFYNSIITKSVNKYSLCDVDKNIWFKYTPVMFDKRINRNSSLMYQYYNMYIITNEINSFTELIPEADSEDIIETYVHSEALFGVLESYLDDTIDIGSLLTNMKDMDDVLNNYYYFNMIPVILMICKLTIMKYNRD